MASESRIREQIEQLLDRPVTDAALDEMTWGFLDFCGPYEPVRMPIVRMLAEAFADVDVPRATTSRPVGSIQDRRATPARPPVSARQQLAASA